MRGFGTPRMRRVRPRKQLERIGDQPLERRVRIADLMHEGAVRAVLEQPAHEIGEQIAMPADRRIHAAREAGLGDQRVVQRVAHALQLLELEGATASRQLEHGRDRAAVVGGELRKEPLARAEQRLRAGDVGNVGRALPREHRVVVEPEYLRDLDLGVPVRAL